MNAPLPNSSAHEGELTSYILNVEIILNITFSQIAPFISIKACHLQIHANLFLSYTS